MPCRLVNSYRYFEGSCFLYLQAQAVQFYFFALKIEAIQSFETSKTIINPQGAASGKTKSWNKQCIQIAAFYIHGLCNKTKILAVGHFYMRTIFKPLAIKERFTLS